MSKLVILVHPDMPYSVVNNIWKKQLLADGITVHDLYRAYPDSKIDVQHEQSLIEKHDTIIFQFPFYWYSSPPLLKQWFDEVLTDDFAYATAFKMKDKKIALAVSIGDKEFNYQPDGNVTFTFDELITPYIATCIYIKAEFAGYHTLYNTPCLTEEEIKGNAVELSEFIKNI